ncbi:MAG: twin-arginine translocation signal domain-containing protein [Proteobacteria bacterium]|nr:twin-arginine translocation signal domain-containing protein [Pseudomonadota bacterium]
MKDSNKKIGRRKFLKAAGAVGAATLVASCSEGGDAGADCIGAPAVLRKKRSLKMVTTWPKNFPGIGTGAERVARRITELTDGGLDIRVYGAGELVPALGAFDAVSQGKADIYHGAEYYWQGKSRAFNFFAAVPFGMTAGEMKAWIYHDGGQELWDELSAAFNIKPFMAGNSGTQMGGWFRSELKGLADLQGLRMRIPGLGGEVMARMGAVPVTKAGGELFLALSQGNIDATEWIGPWNDLAFGFHTIAKYYYYPGFHEPGTTLSMGMNLDLWEDLSNQERAAVESAAAAENDYTLAEFNAQNARALTTLIEEHGVKLTRFPDEILDAMARLSVEVLAETAASDALTGRVYESFAASMARTSRWGEIGERAFTEIREKAMTIAAMASRVDHGG